MDRSRNIINIFMILTSLFLTVLENHASGTARTNFWLDKIIKTFYDDHKKLQDFLWYWRLLLAISCPHSHRMMCAASMAARPYSTMLVKINWGWCYNREGPIDQHTSRICRKSKLCNWCGGLHRPWVREGTRCILHFSANVAVHEDYRDSQESYWFGCIQPSIQHAEGQWSTLAHFSLVFTDHWHWTHYKPTDWDMHK